jgi:hypothetical protein
MGLKAHPPLMLLPFEFGTVDCASETNPLDCSCPSRPTPRQLSESVDDSVDSVVYEAFAEVDDQSQFQSCQAQVG